MLKLGFVLLLIYIISYLKKEMSGYTTLLEKEKSNNIEVQNTKYVFLPVFVLNIKYKDKIYHFAMNGQTKKLVGEIPVDKTKLLMLICGLFVIGFVVLLLIFMMMGYRW